MAENDDRFRQMSVPVASEDGPAFVLRLTPQPGKTLPKLNELIEKLNVHMKSVGFDRGQAPNSIGAGVNREDLVATFSEQQVLDAVSRDVGADVTLDDDGAVLGASPQKGRVVDIGHRRPGATSTPSATAPPDYDEELDRRAADLDDAPPLSAYGVPSEAASGADASPAQGPGGSVADPSMAREQPPSLLGGGSKHDPVQDAATQAAAQQLAAEQKETGELLRAQILALSPMQAGMAVVAGLSTAFLRSMNPGRLFGAGDNKPSNGQDIQWPKSSRVEQVAREKIEKADQAAQIHSKAVERLANQLDADETYGAARRKYLDARKRGDEKDMAQAANTMSMRVQEDETLKHAAHGIRRSVSDLEAQSLNSLNLLDHDKNVTAADIQALKDRTEKRFERVNDATDGMGDDQGMIQKALYEAAQKVGAFIESILRRLGIIGAQADGADTAASDSGAEPAASAGPG